MTQPGESASGELLRATARGWAGMLTGQAGYLRLIAQDLDDGIGTAGDAAKDLRQAAEELLGASAAIDRLADRIHER